MNAAGVGLLVRMVAAAAHGGEPIRPAIDVPLRDAVVMHGPGGVCYMTGIKVAGVAALGDSDNNRRVRVGSSGDLHECKDLRSVWDLWQDPGSNAHGRGDSARQTKLCSVVDVATGTPRASEAVFDTIAVTERE